MAKRQGHDKLKFKKKSRENMPHKDLLPGIDYEVLNDCEDLEEQEEQVKVFEEEISVERVVKNEEEGEINEEHERFFEDDLIEGMIEEPEEDDTEQAIDKLIEAFPEDVIVEGEELLQEVADNNDKEQEMNDRPIREQREPNRLIYRQVTIHGTIKVGKMNFQQAIHEQEHNLFAQMVRQIAGIYYLGHESLVMAQLMEEISTRYSLMTQHMLHKGLKIFRERSVKAIGKEVGQLHNRTCFRPISIKTMTTNKHRKAQVALAYLGEKGNGDVKGIVVFNGKPTREYLGKEDSTSPTASVESVFLTCVIHAHKGRDIMSADVPNAFIQAIFPRTPGQDRTVMKITGKLVDILVNMHPNVYRNYVVLKKGKRVLYAEILKAIYGMLEAALLWYQQFRP